MALTAEQVAAASLWLDQYVNAAEQTKEAAARAAQASWLGFEAWYSATATAALAAEMAQMSQAGQDIVAGSAQQFIANIVAIVRGTRPVTIPRPRTPVIRNGAPLPLVHTRPAETYKRAVALGKTHEAALNLAVQRAAQTQLTDLTLAERAAQQSVMEQLGVTTFRRIVRPELSETGSCGLCIAASDRIYTVATLMPIHPPSCKCKTMPIVGDNDPGRSLNKADLKRLYADAGGDDGPSTAAKDLRRTRYRVDEHGEFGPYISKAGDNFRGPNKVALEDDPERAAHMLSKAEPVLATLENRARLGEDVAGPLAYQRDLVSRLRGIAG